MPRDYPVGVTLCNQGDLATHVFILLAGWVKILSTTQDGHEIVLALRGDGDIVGEIGGEIDQRERHDSVHQQGTGVDRAVRQVSVIPRR